MISFSHKFIFVHVPKTAGNALQTVLQKYSEDEVVRTQPHHDGVERFEVRGSLRGLRKHATLAQYRSALGRRDFRKFYSFACVRNPWERAISHYFSPYRGVVTWDREAFIRFLPAVKPLARYLAFPFDRLLGRRWEKNVNRIMRYETLEEDFRAACADIGLPTEPLAVRNRGEREHYARYYDAALRDLIARRYRDEIQRFGYDFS